MNALVTGTNRGIGKAILGTFAQNGINVWAHARKRDELFEAFCSELSFKYSVTIEAVYFDLTDEASIDAAMKGIFAQNKKIDILVNNAGVAYGGLLTMTSLAKMKSLYEVNVFAQVRIMQLVARHMMRQKSGCIINMCSVGGIEANPGYLAYGSSKAALLWITKCVSKELGSYGIRVNGVAPGLIETDMGYYKSEDELNKTIQRSSLRRMGKPQDVADLVYYLSSDAASYITGSIFSVDGGRL